VVILITLKRRAIPRKPAKTKATLTSREKALAIMGAALTKHVADLICFQVSELSSLTEYYVIGSGDSEPQMRAIMDAVEEELAGKGCRPLGIEGLSAATWILMDYNDVIFHLFRKETRMFYNLDKIWIDAPRIDANEMLQKKTEVISARRKKKGP